MRLGRTTLLHFGSQVAVSVAGFAATFAIARLLGPGPLGTYAVVVALTFWFNIPAASLGEAVTKRVSEADGPGAEYVSTGLAMALGAAVLVALGSLVAAGPVASYIGADVTALFAALLVTNVGFLVVVAALEGRKQVGRAGVLKAVERVLRTGLQIGFIVGGAAVAGLVAGHIVAMAVGGLLGIGLLGARGALRLPTRSAARSLLRYARYSWLGGLTARAFGWMDTVVLALFVPSLFIGVYEVAWNLASMLALVSVSIQRTLFPEFSDLGEESRERVHHYLDEGLTFTGLFVIPGLFGAWSVGARVLKIYDPAFTRGATILVVLVLARAISAYGSQLRSAINALDRPDLAFRVNAAFVATNVVLNLALVGGLTYAGYPPSVAWYGAAAATLLSAVVAAGLSYRALAGLIGRPSVPYGEIGRQIAAAVVMAGAVVAAAPLVPRNHYATIVLIGAAAGVYTVALLGLSGRVRGKALGLYRDVLA